MTRFTILTVLAAVLVVPTLAAAQLDAGVHVWRQRAELDVKSASDFDGTDETGAERARNWDAESAGFGVVASYKFPRILRAYGGLALAQSTVSFLDIADPARDVRTLAMDNAVHILVGLRPEGEIPSHNLFWSAGAELTYMQSGLQEDVLQSWDYTETTISVDGRFGYRYQNLGFFTGLRLVRYDGDLQETDLGNLPALQTRQIDFAREDILDLMLGIETSGDAFAGSVELGFVGAMSARAGIVRRF
jgi:hypothetical protein